MAVAAKDSRFPLNKSVAVVTLLPASHDPVTPALTIMLPSSYKDSMGQMENFTEGQSLH